MGFSVLKTAPKSLIQIALPYFEFSKDWMPRLRKEDGRPAQTLPKIFIIVFLVIYRRLGESRAALKYTGDLGRLYSGFRRADFNI